MPYRSNINSVIARLQKVPDKIDAKVKKTVHTIILKVDEGVHEKTPVWSGLAIRNMIWSEGSPNLTEYPEIKSGSVEDEGRRSANQAAAQKTRDMVLDKLKPYAIYYLSNASHHIFELEAGQLPSPQRSRVPAGGMFGLTYAQLKNGGS